MVNTNQPDRKEESINIPHTGMNDNHRRNLSSALKVIEKLISEIETGISDTDKGVMFHLSNHMSDSRKREILMQITDIRSFIKILHSKYNLLSETLNLEWLIKINQTKMWEILCDINRKRLNNYGHIDVETGSEIESDVEKLLKMIEDL